MRPNPPPSIPVRPARGKLAWALWRIARLPLVAYLLVLLMFAHWENSLIYFPMKYPAGDWEPFGLKVDDATFTAADGTQLHGWYSPADQPIAVILFCHGNAGNVTHRADALQAVQAMQASILVFDYRGYGRSEGTPSEAGVLADARAARKWLAERAGVGEQDVVLMGESLGGGVAVELAAKDGARGLVLQDTFSSLPDVAAYHYPWLPVRWLMQGRLDSVSLIDQYHGPLLMAHGDADMIVPFPFAEKLFAAANEPKRFLREPGANHNDAPAPEFYPALEQFLRDLPPPRTAAP
jgi:fermentation-respiration switch protein FrsA (DUF1100 family)